MSISAEQLAKHAAWLRDEDGGERLALIGANLSRANLSMAKLIGANLSGANLNRAKLNRADLNRADLSMADLSGANLSGADLSGANLNWTNLSGANLNWTNLSGADLSRANLSGADLSRALGLKIAADSEQRLKEVAKIILSGEGELAMGDWHTCETTHCLAGWAIHQAGELGLILEANVGPHMAGLQLLGIEAASHFYDSTKDAMKWLESIA